MTAPATAEPADQGAGLARVHRAQASSRSSGAAPGRRGLEIEHLAADHSGRARGVRDDADHLELFAGPSSADSPPSSASARARAARTLRSAARRRRESPCASPWTTCDVGRPRRMRVVVHRREVVVDRASRCGSARSRTPPASRACRRPPARARRGRRKLRPRRATSIGRRRLPPARRL